MNAVRVVCSKDFRLFKIEVTSHLVPKIGGSLSVSYDLGWLAYAYGSVICGHKEPNPCFSK